MKGVENLALKLFQGLYSPPCSHDEARISLVFENEEKESMRVFKSTARSLFRWVENEYLVGAVEISISKIP